MPDISMCTDHGCSLRDKCYRYTATPGMWQTYAGFSQDEDGNCDYFWDNEK